VAGYQERTIRKIEAAAKDLIRVIEKHAQLSALEPVPPKKAERAAVELRTATTAHTPVVKERTGQVIRSSQRERPESRPGVLPWPFVAPKALVRAVRGR